METRKLLEELRDALYEHRYVKMPAEKAEILIMRIDRILAADPVEQERP